MGLKEALGDNKKFLFLAFALLIVSVIMMLSLNSNKYSPIRPLGESQKTYTEPEQVMQEGVDYSITIKTSVGDIYVDLYESKAPKNVNSLLFLIGERYYEGLTFHKVIKDFVIQAGDTEGDGSGDPGYTVTMENTKEPFSDYTLGMANASQFFIVLPNSNKDDFNGKFSPIGRVTSGFAVVNAISKAEVSKSYKPKNDITINSIQITE